MYRARAPSWRNSRAQRTLCLIAGGHSLTPTQHHCSPITYQPVEKVLGGHGKVGTHDLPTSPGHSFYRKLNGFLAEAGFDDYVEGLNAAYYAGEAGRGSPRDPPLVPP